MICISLIYCFYILLGLFYVFFHPALILIFSIINFGSVRQPHTNLFISDSDVPSFAIFIFLRNSLTLSLWYRNLFFSQITSLTACCCCCCFFYRLTQDQHFAPMVPLDYTLRSQRNLAFPVEFDVIYILITSFALGNNSQKCWFPAAESL